MCEKNGLLDKLAAKMPQSFWDNLVRSPYPWEPQPPRVRVEDIRAC